MRVRFTDEAKAKLRAIHTHIAQDSPARAKTMIERLTKCAQRLVNLPFSGRQVPEYPLDILREVLERPYRIIYRIKPDEIEVVTIIHYRQLLPEDLL